MRSNRENLQTSVLDRLVDSEPKRAHEPVRYRLVNINQIKVSVIRDLEQLLNTKRQIIAPPAAYREVNNSLFVYGLQDYTALNPRSKSVRHQLRQDIEKTIARFEPRIKNLTVKFEMPDQKERNLRFRITGLLVIEAAQEPIAFDTFFDVSRGEYRITE
jgi:type VI secretion system protein ImpF